MDRSSAYSEPFRKRGLRVTPQRVAILHAVHEHANHPSAEDVFRSVRSVFPSLSLTTVYRTLETLAELGEIELVHVGGDRARFDHRLEPHYHAVCTRCGRIADVEVEGSCIQECVTVPLFGGERPRGNAVVFYGECTTCRSDPAS